MTAPGQIFDRALHRRRLERAAAGGGKADFLRRRVADDLVERLASINRRFPITLDLGARHGAFAEALRSSGEAAKIGLLIESDLCEPMLRGRRGARLVADDEHLPFAPASLDLVVSCLTLHWVGDLVGTLIQLRQALRPDGLLLVSMLGGATLTELREALMEGEVVARGGTGPRISPFADAFDAAGLLQRAGFALPVVDIDRVTVFYDHPLKLLAELRAMGETNILADRPSAPLTRAVLAGMCETYGRKFRDRGGRVRATFEILTLTGWAPHPDQPKSLKRGTAKQALADSLRAAADARAGRVWS